MLAAFRLVRFQGVERTDTAFDPLRLQIRRQGELLGGGRQLLWRRIPWRQRCGGDFRRRAGKRHRPTPITGLGRRRAKTRPLPFLQPLQRPERGAARLRGQFGTLPGVLDRRFIGRSLPFGGRFKIKPQRRRLYRPPARPPMPPRGQRRPVPGPALPH